MQFLKMALVTSDRSTQAGKKYNSFQEWHLFRYNTRELATIL